MISQQMPSLNQHLLKLEKSRIDSCETDALPLLPESTVNSVEKVEFFVGYHRSGHSMIGSVMDAQS